jgi:tape measure domain-containing protein
MTIEVDIVANESNIESALKKISLGLKTLQVESKAVASNISNIGVKNIDSNKISQEIKSLKTDLNKTNREISKSVSSLSSGFSNLATNITLALTGGALGAGFVAITSKFNDLENRIALVTGRTDDLILTQEELVKISARTYTSVDGSVESFNRFGLALRDAGVETSTLLEVTENVQKAIAISGGSAQSTTAAIFQLGQGLSAGALRGQELNSVLEQAPRIATAIADELGVTIGELRRIAEEGGITTDVVLRSLLNQGSAINEEFGKINPSISKASVVFLDAVTNYVGQLDKGLRLSQTIASSVLKVSDSLNKAAIDLDLRMAEKIAGLNIVQTFKDMLLVSGGIFNVLGAIAGRIGDSLPKVILPVLNLLNELYLGFVAIPTLEFFSTLTRGFLDIRGNFLDFITLSDTVAGAIANVFTSETPQELRDNLDILAMAIENAGKKWFNVFNKMTTLVRQTNIFLLETGIYLGLVNQKLIMFRFDTFEDFNWLLRASNHLIKELYRNLLTLPIVLKVLTGLLILESYLIVLGKAFTNTFKEIQVVTNSYLDKTISSIRKFSTSVKKEFYNLYIYLVGNSVWPDTIEGIYDWSGKLEKNVLPIINNFVTKVKGSFRELYKFVKDISNRNTTLNFSEIFNFENSNFILAKQFISDLIVQVSNLSNQLKAGVLEKLKSFSSFNFSLDFDLKLKTATALSTLISLIKKVEVYLAVNFAKGIANLWLYLAENAPLLADILGAGIVVGLAELFGIKLYQQIRLLALGSLLAVILNEVSASIGELLVQEGFFTNLGNNFGELLGVIITSFLSNLPLILQALLDIVKGFAQGLLAEFGILGSLVSGLLNLAGTGGNILQTILFGSGIALLTGNFKSIMTVINVGLTLLLNRSIGGVGKAGILQYLLLGKGKLVIAGILAVIAVLNLIPGVFNDIGNSVSTFLTLGGIVSLLVFGPGGTVKGIIKSLDFVMNYIGLMSGLMAVNGPRFNLAGYLWPATGAIGLKARILAFFAWFRFQYYSTIGGGTLLAVFGNKLRQALVSFTSFYTSTMINLRSRSIAIGGPIGAIGNVLFGRVGRAAILATLILGIFATAATAGQDAASSGFGFGASALEYGLLGIMLLGVAGPRKLKAAVVGLVNFIKLQFRALVVGVGIEAAIAAAMGAGFKAGLLSIGVMLLRFIGGIFALLFSKVALVIAGIGILGLILFGKGNSLTEKWNNFKESVTNFFTDTTAGGRAARESIESILEPLRDSKLGNLKLSGSFKALDKVDLGGLNESQIGDMRASLKKSVSRLEELKQIYAEEGNLTRGERREANELLRSIDRTIGEAPEVGSRESQTNNISAILSSIDKMGFGQLPQNEGWFSSTPDLETATTAVTTGKTPLSFFIDLEGLRNTDPIIADLVETMSFAMSEGLAINPKIQRDLNEALQDLLVFKAPVGNKNTLISYLSDSAKALMSSSTGTLEERLNAVYAQRSAELKKIGEDYKNEVGFVAEKVSLEEAISRINSEKAKLGLEALTTEQKNLLTLRSTLELQRKLSDLTKMTVNVSNKTLPLFPAVGYATDESKAERERVLKEYEIFEKLYLSKNEELVSNVNTVLSDLGVNLSLDNFDLTKLPSFFANVEKVLAAEAAAAVSGNSAAALQQLEAARQAMMFQLIDYKTLLSQVVNIVPTDISFDQIFGSTLGTQNQIANLGKKLLDLNNQIGDEAFTTLPMAMKEGILAQKSSIVKQIVDLFRQVAIETRSIDYFTEGNALESQIETFFSSFSGNTLSPLPLTIMGPEARDNAVLAIEDIQKAYTDLQTDMSNGIKPDFQDSLGVLASKLGTTEIEFSSFTDRLEYARSLADNPISFGELIQLPREKLNSITILTTRLRALQIRMALLKAFGAITGQDIVVGLSAVAAQIDEVMSEIDVAVPDAPDTSPDSGGGAAAKTWWEGFTEALSSMDLSIDEKVLAGISSSAIDSLVSASAKYKAAQDAINKSTKDQVELRRQSLEIMRQERQLAINSLDNGTFGAAKAKASMMNSSIDESTLAYMNKAQLASKAAIEERIQSLVEERDVMTAGSAEQVRATFQLQSLNWALEGLQESAMMLPDAFTAMKDSFQSAIAAFLKGEVSFKSVLTSMLDTFTNSIIDSFAKTMTDKLFGNIFANMFGGGGGGGGGLLNLFKAASPVMEVATGGYISGPGGPTSDSIMAMLSNGEYVVNAATTKRWLPFLETLNSNDGRLPAFANGGSVGPSNPVAFKVSQKDNKNKQQQVFNINVTGDVSMQARKEIARMIPEITAGVNMTNRERGSR